MKLKIILLTLILMGVQLGARSQNLSVSPEVVDLQQVELKSKNEIRIVCRNLGDKPLVIRSVDVDCKCTKPEWSRAPILPGDSTVVRVGFVPTDRGAFFKTIRFVTVPQSSEKVNVVLRGKVK